MSDLVYRLSSVVALNIASRWWHLLPYRWRLWWATEWVRRNRSTPVSRWAEVIAALAVAHWHLSRMTERQAMGIYVESITSAPERRSSRQQVPSADDPASAQAVPEHNHPRESRCLITECPVGGARAALEGLDDARLDLLGLLAEMGDLDAPYNRKAWVATLRKAVDIIDARLAALAALEAADA